MPREAKQPALDPQLKALGQKIRKRREQLGFSQDALADSAGIDRTYVSQIERGVRNFGITYLFTLASALRVKPRDLL